MAEIDNARTHRQHAVPQHIAAFEFRLIGNFTLKQFLYFGGFGFLAFLTYLSPLHPIIKIPTVLIFAFAGIALAFIPIKGRPLDTMLAAFVKAVFSPTQRIWLKSGTVPEFFQPGFGVKPSAAIPTTPAASRKVLEEYLSQFRPSPSAADVAESAYLQSLDFGVTIPAKVALAAAQAAEERAKAAPKIEEIEVLPGLAVEERRPAKKPAVVPLAAAVNFVERPVITIPSPGVPPIYRPAIGQVKVRRLHTRPDLTGEFVIPVRGETRFEVSPSLAARLGLEEEFEMPQTKTKIEEIISSKFKPSTVAKAKTDLKTKKTAAKIAEPAKTAQPAKFSTFKVIPPPMPAVASKPNILNGTAKDKAGHLLEDAILIVKNEAGVPVRALKTNLLGQFVIATALPAGRYKIEAEKEGYSFDIIEFEAKDEVLPHLEIVAK